MESGFEIYNDQNVVQVTGSLKNLQLVSKGSKTTPCKVIAPKDSVIAIRCDPGHWATVYDDPSMLVATGYVTGETTSFTIIGSGTVYYYVFSFSDTMVSGKYLEVFNSSGKLVFSADSYMRVLAILSGVPEEAGYPSQYADKVINTSSYPLATTIAVVPCRLSMAFTYGGNRMVHIQSFLFSEGLLTSLYKLITPYSPSSSYSNMRGYAYLVLDVTNL